MLDVVRRTIAEFAEVGERRVGVDAGVVQPARCSQHTGGVATCHAGSVEITSLLTVANVLLEVMQRAVDVASIGPNGAELVVNNTAIVDGSVGQQVERVRVRSHRVGGVAGELVGGPFGIARFLKAFARDAAELGERPAAAEVVARRPQVQALSVPALGLIEIAQLDDVLVGMAQVEGAHALRDGVADGLIKAEGFAVGVGAGRVLLFPLDVREFVQGYRQTADDVALLSVSVLGRGIQRRSDVLPVVSYVRVL